MMSHDLAAALLRDVPLHDSHHDHGGWVYRAEVLAALTAALNGVDERAETIISALQTHGSGFHVDDDLQRWIIPTTDLITAILAHNAALRAERDSARTYAAEVRLREKAAEDARIAAEAEVEKLREKIRDWEARIDDCEWSTNTSLTEGIRAEMRAALTTEADNDRQA